MSDTTNENARSELDEYGVWVKTPPHSAQEGGAPAESDIGLPDFSFLDNIAQADGNTGTAESAPQSTEDAASGITAEETADFGDGEISLDDFITDGFSSDSDSPSSDSGDGEISLDEFGLSDESMETSQEEVQEEEPLDMDLTFDDSVETQDDTRQDTAEADAGSETSSSGDDGAIFADDFDALFDTMEDGAAQKTEPERTETVPDEDFGIAQDTSGSSEEIDLSEFGLDESDGPAQNSGEGHKPAESNDFDIEVTTDDASPSASQTESGSDEDDEAISLDIQTNESPAESGMSVTPAGSEGDFDVDSILDSVDLGDSSPAEETPSPAETTYGNTESLASEPLSFTDITSDEVSADEPDAESPAQEPIPDTFDEEAASLSVQEDAGGVQQPVPRNDESFALLRQISTELASLKSEINTLKTEFTELKNKAPGSAVTQDEKHEEPESTAIPDVPSPATSTGFFEEDGDDTIALSGDELNNILSTAEFSQEDEASSAVSSEEVLLGSPTSVAEVPQEDFIADNGLNMDFDNETLEEPTFDESDLAESFPEDTAAGNTETQEDEILVPKSDESLDPESIVVQGEETGTDDAFSSEAPDLESLQRPIDLFREETPEPLTDDDTEFLKSEPVTEAETEETEETEETLETGISEEPVRTVFNQWENSSEADDDTEEEPFAEDDIAQEVGEEPAQEESADAAESAEEENIPEESSLAQDDEPCPPEPETETVEAPAYEAEVQIPAAPLAAESAPSVTEDRPQEQSDGTITEEMKQEIKSVLLYMDQLLESLPEEKITEFAQSEQFETYRRLFSELGLA